MTEEEQEEQEDENKRIRPRERARGQKNSIRLEVLSSTFWLNRALFTFL